MGNTLAIVGSGFIIAGGVMLAFFTKTESRQSQNTIPKAHSVLEFTMQTVDGESRPLAQYKGDVLMIVNTASKCGYTPQYETLEQLYRTYRDKGFRILAFPANNFLWQEPGTNEEIKKFCTEKYNVTFDIFGKISVKGRDKHPLYKYITEDSPLPGEIKWNFQKYLVDRGGKIASRFAPATDPMSNEVREKVEQLLAE